MTISTSFMTAAGLKKWVPTTLSLRSVAPAMAVTGRTEVFEARIAAGLQILSSSAKIFFLRSRLSGTASMTKSASLAASFRSVEVLRSFSVASACSCASFPFSTRLPRLLRIWAAPLSANSWATSYSTTLMPAEIAACAMPCPIVPAPNTVMFLTSTC
jgi:hypothetical protein